MQIAVEHSHSIIIARAYYVARKVCATIKDVDRTRIHAAQITNEAAM